MKTQKQIIADMLGEVSATVRNFSDLIEKNELEPYLKGNDIRGDLVDKSEDITPEQVCILGEYVMAASLLENLKLLSEGKSVGKQGLEFAKESASIEAFKIDVKTGKQTKISKLPKEVMDQLKKFVEENDNE